MRKLRFKQNWLAEFDILAALSANRLDQLPTKVDTVADKNPPGEDIAKANSDGNVGNDVQAKITMAKQNPETVPADAIAPEVAAASPKSAEAEALLANESDEAQTTTLSSGSSGDSDGPPEAGLSEEMADIEAAAEAEVIEKVNSGTGANAATAMPVDPEVAALAKGATVPNSAT